MSKAFYIGKYIISYRNSVKPLTIPLDIDYTGTSTILNESKTLYTNETGNDIFLNGYIKGVNGAGLIAAVYAQFRTADNTILYEITSTGTIQFNFILQKGQTLILRTTPNYTAGGFLIDREIILVD